MSDLLIFALCHFRSPGDQWKIIGRPLPDYCCCYWFTTFRFFAFPHRQLHPLSPTFPLTKLFFFNPTLVFRSLVCSPLHTLHQTGRKTRVGFGAETSCSRAEVWFGAPNTAVEEGMARTSPRRSHGSMPAVTPQTYFSRITQSRSLHGHFILMYFLLLGKWKSKSQTR